MSDQPQPAQPDQSQGQAPANVPHADGGPMILCPYCGYTQPHAERCSTCGGLFEPLSRMATQIAMGPWFIRDKANPFKPGFSIETLKKMVENGRVKPYTVIRGPSTHQFWSIARNVSGVAHMLGYCHQCGEKVDPRDKACPHCMATFRSFKDRDRLGLQYPTKEAVEAAQKKLNEALGIAPPPEPAKSDGKPNDLLQDVIGGPSQAGAGSGAMGGGASGAADNRQAQSGGMMAGAGQFGGLSSGGSGNAAAATAPGAGLMEQALGNIPSSGGGGTAPTGVPGQPQTLDFGPGDGGAFREREPDFQRPRSPIHPIVWVLLALNVLAVLGLGTLYFLSQIS